MRTLAFVAVALLLALTLAGCSNKDPERYPDGVPSTSTSSRPHSSSTSRSSSTSTSTGPMGATNHAPTASVAVVVNGTAAAFNLTGQDQDNDTLSWVLTFGDGNQTNGTSLPAGLAHNYTAAGNYTANLTVSDGQANATSNVTFAVGGGGGPSQTAQVTWPVPNAACGADYPKWPVGTPGAGVSWAELAIDPATVGKPYVAVLTYEDPTGAVGAVSMGFYDGATPANFVDGGFFEFSPTTEVAGTVPAGAVTAVFFDCFTTGGTVVDYTAG